MPKTIVWIEDDTDIIGSVVRQLERAGYKIERLRSARDVFENLDLVRRCDLILLDMILPKGGVEQNFGQPTGLGILRQLRQEFQVTQPVVVLSVIRREEIAKELKQELGVKDIITKPVRPSELKRRVEAALGISE